jgi:tetratricopeptide (TPR) repeat protein
MVDILNVGVILHNQGDDERAIDYYNRALAQCKKFHGNRVHVNAVLNMGLLFRDQGNYEKALEWYNQVLYQFERPSAGDNRHLTNVPQNMGAIAYSRRYYNDTKPLTESSRGYPQEYRERIRLISQDLKEAMLALLSKQRNNSFFGNDDLGYYGF